MDSDSDSTIDSDELERIIARSKKTGSSENIENSEVSNKRNPQTHNLSDSDSNGDSKVKKLQNKERRHKSENNRKPVCRYGSKCYRKNPDHKKAFYHPTNVHESDPKESEKLDEILVLSESCKKFQFYVTHVYGIPSSYNRGVSFGIKELLSLEDSTLVSSAQFDYMFDIPWLMEQYPEKYRDCPLTIIHGEIREAKKSLEKSGENFPNIKFCQAKLDIPYGTHHTKMMFLLYKEGFRVVIHTSNIVPSDWSQKTQGMWISPLLPKLNKASTCEGESPTNFKSDLLEYVSAYKASGLNEWCEVIKSHDFSGVQVFLIGSVPGRHIGSMKTAYGHLKLRKILNLYGPSKDDVKDDWCVVGQFSSIGSLGATPDQWLLSEFGSSLITCKNTSNFPKSSSFKLIYPSVENVRKSLEGYPAGASLPYSIKVAQKQSYLKSFLHQWKSDNLGRSEASPHIKTYMRLSPDAKKIAWFLVTSANLSKAAWGSLEKKGSQLMIRSYELGVLFLPKYYGIETFSSPLHGETKNTFPVPYDIPLQPYLADDEPWIWDIPHIKGPDRFGNMWCPP